MYWRCTGAITQREASLGGLRPGIEEERNSRTGVGREWRAGRRGTGGFGVRTPARTCRRRGSENAPERVSDGCPARAAGTVRRCDRTAAG
ncbi:hypothetical protein GCM10010273_31370 [Streptomyces lavendulocolor]